MSDLRLAATDAQAETARCSRRNATRAADRILRVRSTLYRNTVGWPEEQ